MTSQDSWTLVNVLGKGLIWGFISAPSVAVVTFVMFFWILPWLFDTAYLEAVLLAVIAGIAGFSVAALAALLSQVPKVFRLPLWCQLVHISAVLAIGFLAVVFTVEAVEFGRSFL